MYYITIQELLYYGEEQDQFGFVTGVDIQQTKTVNEASLNLYPSDCNFNLTSL